MYFQETCPHCVNAKKALQNHISQIELKNLKNKKNYQEFIELGGRGVPLFVSKKTHKTFSGNPQTFTNLISKLNVGAPQKLKDLKVKIFVSDSCGYCKKLKQMLQHSNEIRNVRIISLSDSAYQKEASSYKIDGYPFIVSEKTGKFMLGAPPSVASMISALQ